jgi:hypothetical protein
MPSANSLSAFISSAFAITAAAVAIKPLSVLLRGDAAVLEASGFSGLAEGEAMNVTYKF